MSCTKEMTVTAAGGVHNAVPVSVLLADAGSARSVRMVESAGGRAVPCQLESTGEGPLLTWIAEGLEAGASKRYEAALSDALPSSPEEAVRLEHTADERLDVTIDGKLFTSYYFGAQWHRPYLHPLVGPYGDPVTRGFPMIENVPGETSDHLWHRGLYSAYGEVNGIDNWTEGEGRGHTVHREFEALESGPVYARAAALSDWTTPDRRKALLVERRDMRFYRLPLASLIDIDLTLTAEEDVLFGDTKEGGLIALRVASSMDVLRGGRMENSLGGVNEGDLWGKRAAWCDYSGPVNGKTVGVAVFDHPQSFRHPAYWHARDYGLLTTNPFAVSTFEGGGPSGEYLLPAGESLLFRYRVYVHAGGAAEAGVAEHGGLYADPPAVLVE